MLKLFLFCGALIVAGTWLAPQRGIVHPPGVIAPIEPVQQSIAKPKPWQFEGHTITPLATYDIDARVLSTAYYWVPSRETKLSSYDLVLGWGKMSDQQVLDTMTITQSNRWFEWSWHDKRPPISDADIISHSANVHMIASDEAALRRLSQVTAGQVIHARGYLIQAKAADGWMWTSSLSRTDTGKGACEVMWVEEITVRNE